ncbi:uncharacterized protein LOC118436210 [Folsomia candida]|uniref:Tetraspanin n=1 Tax=Folsomia candida TaxID=158441 RepID=A0A226E4S7_FOLCA|nr:uncharacterized protein LOC118436210 [Folsomia candida]OXA52288.1 hypothetical protein Fcan01_12844 [Folsomia candida]
MNKENDWRLPQIRFPLEKVRLLILQFLICNIVLVIYGTIELIVTFALKESKAEYFLYIIDDVNDNCSYLIKGSCMCSIIVGLVAILTHMLGYPGRILCSLSCLLICSFSLMTIGVGEAASTYVTNEQMYRRVMEMDRHYYNHRDSLFPMSKDTTLTTEFQHTFSCCGMFSTKDWYLSNCNCMPLSCSKRNKVSISKPFFMTNNSLNKLGYGIYDKLQPLIWETGCLAEIQSTTAKLKKKWLIIIGVSAIIHFLLTTWYFHISSILTELLLSPVGNVQLQIFRAHWPSKGIKVKPEYKRFARVDGSFEKSRSTSLSGNPTAWQVLEDDDLGGVPRMTISLASITNSRQTENIHDTTEVKVRFVRDDSLSRKV